MKPNTARKPRWGSRPYRAPKALEGDFKTAVLDYLKWEQIWAMNVVAGLFRFPGPVDQQTRWGQGAPKGTADVLVMIPAGRKVCNFLTGAIEECPCARIGWIETKRPGGRLRPEQKEFAERCERDGALFWKLDNAADLRRAIPPKMELF